MSRRATQEGEAGGRGERGPRGTGPCFAPRQHNRNRIWSHSTGGRECDDAAAVWKSLVAAPAGLESVDAELYSRSTAASAPGEGCFYLCTAGATAPRSRSGVHGSTAQRQPRRWSRSSWPWSEPCARAAPSAPRWRAGWQRPGRNGRVSQGAVVSGVRCSRSVARSIALAITSRQQPVAVTCSHLQVWSVLGRLSRDGGDDLAPAGRLHGLGGHPLGRLVCVLRVRLGHLHVQALPAGVADVQGLGIC